MNSLTSTVYQRLHKTLLTNQIRPGERIRINEIATQLGVSLGAVREALSRLTSDGLVIAEPQRGFRAAPVSVEELHDLTSVWIQIEMQCFRRSFVAGGIEWQSRLLAAHHRLTRTPMVDGSSQKISEAWMAAHDEFHRSLISGCDSAVLLGLRQQLFVRTERYRLLMLPVSHIERDLSGEHNTIVDAVLNGDADNATMLLEKHMLETSTRLANSGILQGIAADTPD